MLKPINIMRSIQQPSTRMYTETTLSHRYNNCTYIEGALKQFLIAP